MGKPTKQQIAKWKKNRKAWVKALRSGKYEQGTAQLLTDEGGYCCLGVLCDVIGMKPHRKRISKYGAGEVANYFGSTFDVAPLKAMQAVGLVDSHGSFEGRTLAEENDDGTPFSEIADIIESEPEGLFRA